MGTMPMHGDGMMFMPMPGQSWIGAAASFLVMWTAMMAVMMLPSMAPMLWRHRGSLGADGIHREARTGLVGLGYIAVWIVVGVVVFSIGAALASVEMRWPPLVRTEPVVRIAVVVLAVVVQLRRWRARIIGRPAAPGYIHESPRSLGEAWRNGLEQGVLCARSCSALVAIQLALGIMDLRVMAVVTAAITADRLASHTTGPTRIAAPPLRG
jgi:predicted metal-binding membrane protein